MTKSLFAIMLCLLAIVLLFSGVPSTPAETAYAQDNAYPRLTVLPDCQLDPDGVLTFLVPDGEIPGETMECGLLETFEDPLDAASSIIRIAYVILFANQDMGNTDPIVYLEGGPGGSAVSGIDVWLDSSLRDTRDLILVDQRGTGYSAPSLSCYYYVGDEDFEYDEEYYDACIAALQDEDIDFANYHTVNNATDIAYLVQALQVEHGYGPANMLGISYGTRLGLALMRDWPEVVRSAILDSVYPPHVDAYLVDVANTGNALGVVIEACANDAACASAYPNLADDLYDAIQNLYDNPFLYYDEYYEEEYDVYGIDLVYSLFEAQYDVQSVRAFPEVITLAAEGDVQAALDLLYEGPPDAVYGEFEDYYASYSDAELDAYYETYDIIYDADGMFQLLECQEEIAYSDVGNTSLPLPDLSLPDVLIDDLLFEADFFVDDCALWTNSVAPSIESEPAISDVPALLFGGGFDPVTPPAWAISAADYLPNGTAVVVPYASHGVFDVSPCTAQITMAFLDNPTAPIDSSCVAGMTFSFYTP